MCKRLARQLDAQPVESLRAGKEGKDGSRSCSSTEEAGL